MKTNVLGAQKNRPIETVLLSTHNICFGGEIRNLVVGYAPLSGGLIKCKVIHFVPKLNGMLAFLNAIWLKFNHF